LAVFDDAAFGFDLALPVGLFAAEGFLADDFDFVEAPLDFRLADSAFEDDAPDLALDLALLGLAFFVFDVVERDEAVFDFAADDFDLADDDFPRVFARFDADDFDDELLLDPPVFRFAEVLVGILFLSPSLELDLSLTISN